MLRHEPVYVLAVVADFTWLEGINAKHVDALLNELVIGLSFNRRAMFVSLDGEHNYLITELSRIPDSVVFAREGVVEAELEMRH